MTAPRAMPEVILDDDDLLAAALAIGVGALVVNGLLFIGAVTVVTRVGRWIRR